MAATKNPHVTVEEADERGNADRDPELPPDGVVPEEAAPVPDERAVEMRRRATVRELKAVR